MTKLLSGTELVGYIKERQARQVRALRQASHILPKLAIIKSTKSSEVIDVYVRLKERYGKDILIETVVESAKDDDMSAAVERYNADPLVHGIIVQLPLEDPTKTDEIINRIAPRKDVDGLGRDADFDSATAVAITWLVAGYNIELRDKIITIVGKGRLVGTPLAKIWRDNGFNVSILDGSTTDLEQLLKKSDVIITATGVPRLIKSDMLAIGATVIDAGTASENGVLVGDIDEPVRTRHDIVITPEKGGVGPLTIATLFDHVIQAAQKVAERQK